MKQKNLFKIISVILTFALLVGIVPVMTTQADDDYAPEKVWFTKKKVTIKKGQKIEIHVNTAPDDADDDMLEWSIVKGKKYVRIDDDDNDDYDD